MLEPLSEALRERLRIIADHDLRDRDPTAHLKKLQEASEAIQHCEKALSTLEIDAKLRHYLERRSYDKALIRISELTAEKERGSVPVFR